MEKFKIEDFQERLSLKQNNEIKDEFVSRLDEFCQLIFDLKRIPLPVWNTSKEREDGINRLFYDMIYLCSDIRFLIRWVYDENVDSITEDIVLNWITQYNFLVGEFNDYLEMKDIIDKMGYSNVLDEYKKKIMILSNDMFQYKNKYFSQDWSFFQVLNQLEMYYGLYISDINDIHLAVLHLARKGHEKDEYKLLDDVESILVVRNHYEFLKNHYRDDK